MCMQPSQIRRIRENVRKQYKFTAPIQIPKLWNDVGLSLCGQWRDGKLVINAYNDDIDYADSNQADVSALYRYKELFKFIAEDQFKNTYQPRILSAPCHIGLESYTLASYFSYCSYGQRQASALVEAADICSKRLQAAKTGVYPLSFASGIPFDYAGFYYAHEEELVVSDAIKDMVKFLPPIDLSKPDALKNANYTASICLNLMMYLDDDQNEQLIDNLIEATSHMIVIGYGSSLDRFEMVRNKMQQRGFVRDHRKHGINLGTYDVYLQDGLV